MREDMNDQHSKRSRCPVKHIAKLQWLRRGDRKENPDRIIIADGNNVGNTVIHEIIDLESRKAAEVILQESSHITKPHGRTKIRTTFQNQSGPARSATVI